MSFVNDVEDRHKEMIKDLESISIDDLKSSGVSLSFGGRTFKFSELEILSDDSMESRLKKEYKEKLNTQQTRIREKINAKINQLLLMHQQKQQEMDRKERNLRKKYADAAMMPDITQSHMLKGLSVFKGNANDELIWVYKGIYNPRFVIVPDPINRTKTRKPIPARLVNRLKHDILYIIGTKKEKVTSLKTTKTQKDTYDQDLPLFQHYHQTASGDCWGTFIHSKRWKKADDIIEIAKEAEAVLEGVNKGSIASSDPAGLPKLDTLMEAVNKVRGKKLTTKTEPELIDVEDVWQAQ